MRTSAKYIKSLCVHTYICLLEGKGITCSVSSVGMTPVPFTFKYLKHTIFPCSVAL